MKTEYEFAETDKSVSSVVIASLMIAYCICQSTVLTTEICIKA